MNHYQIYHLIFYFLVLINIFVILTGYLLVKHKKLILPNLNMSNLITFFFIYFLISIICAGTLYSCVSYLNIKLDRSKPFNQIVMIQDKYLFKSKILLTENLLYLSFAPNMQYSSGVNVDSKVFEFLNIGDTVKLKMRQGLFGYIWVEELSKIDPIKSPTGKHGSFEIGTMMTANSSLNNFLHGPPGDCFPYGVPVGMWGRIDNASSSSVDGSSSYSYVITPMPPLCMKARADASLPALPNVEHVMIIPGPWDKQFGTVDHKITHFDGVLVPRPGYSADLILRPIFFTPQLKPSAEAPSPPRNLP